MKDDQTEASCSFIGSSTYMNPDWIRLFESAKSSMQPSKVEPAFLSLVPTHDYRANPSFTSVQVTSETPVLLLFVSICINTWMMIGPIFCVLCRWPMRSRLFFNWSLQSFLRENRQIANWDSTVFYVDLIKGASCSSLTQCLFAINLSATWPKSLCVQEGLQGART